MHKTLKCFTVQRNKIGREVPLRNSLHLISSALYTIKKATNFPKDLYIYNNFQGRSGLPITKALLHLHKFRQFHVYSFW